MISTDKLTDLLNLPYQRGAFDEYYYKIRHSASKMEQKNLVSQHIGDETQFADESTRSVSWKTLKQLLEAYSTKRLPGVWIL
jgi:hypothetical protein